jgi:hypothetical protein
MTRLYEVGMFQIGSVFRRTFYQKKFPWQFWVKLAYNDALTYNGSAGGVKASWRHTQYIKAPH